MTAVSPRTAAVSSRDPHRCWIGGAGRGAPVPFPVRAHPARTPEITWRERFVILARLAYGGTPAVSSP
ncbi:hypothetical protein JCM3263A_02210 [Thermobifida fusca]